MTRPPEHIFVTTSEYEHVYQVKQGYKPTEIGVIPEDWDVILLKNIIDPNKKITYGIVVPGPFIQNGIPLIRAQDYSKSWANLSSVYRVSEEVDRAYNSMFIPFA